MIKVYIATGIPDEGKVLELAFTQFSYKVLCSQSGMSNYLEIVQYKPDVIMIELGPEYMDPLSAVKLIRQNRMLKSTPILCFGNHKHLNTISHFIQVGVNKYFLRPLKIGPIIDFFHVAMESSGKKIEKVDLQPKPKSYDDLEQILLAKNLGKQEKLEGITSGLGKLLSFPFAISRIVECTDNEDSGAKDLAKAISTDAAITASVLKISNSIEFHSQNRDINDLSDAIVRIGFNEVKNISLGLSVMKIVENTADSVAFDRTDFWFHSLGVAIYAEKIAKKLFYPNPGFAFLAGLLHEFGNLILDEFFESAFDQSVQTNTKKAGVIEDTQSDLYGITHIDIALSLFKKWKLPTDLITASTHYLNYEEAQEGLAETSSNLVRAVGLAEVLTKCATIGHSCDHIVKTIPSSILKMNHLDGFLNSELQNEVYKCVESFANYLNLPKRPFPDTESIRSEDFPEIAWVDFCNQEMSPHKVFLETHQYKINPLADPAELSDLLESKSIFCLLIHCDDNTDASVVELWKQTLQMNGNLEGKPECHLVCLCEEKGKVNPEMFKDPHKAVLRKSDLRMFEHLLETISGSSHIKS